MMLPTVLAAFLFLGPAQSERVDYVISQLTRDGLAREEVEAFFRDPRLKLYPPQEVGPRKIDWDKIIASLVAPASVKQGGEFVERYREALTQAEETFGVPKQIVAAVLRLESNFGRNTGNYVAFNIFYTILSQNAEERRWKWAGDNLASLVSFCKATGNDCFEVRGSYGGALGPAQFLPRSLVLYGADGNGDNKVDPFEMRDAIFSAAHFLLKHGWEEDRTVALGKYYGSATGYPRAVLAYAEALEQHPSARSAAEAQ